MEVTAALITKDRFIQTSIFVLTMLSMTFVNVPALAAFAPFVGLIVQPFWLYESWSKKQWGIFGLALYISCTWIFGIYSHAILRSYSGLSQMF